MLWSRTVEEDAHSKTLLRVVRYGKGAPVLEKRHFYLDSRTGNWAAGKVKGLNGLDMALLLDRLEEYQEALLAPWRTAR